MKKTAAFILLLISILAIAGCGYKSSVYYEKHPTSVSDLERVWGQPRRVQVLSEDVKRYYYRESNTLMGSRWFLIKGDQVIDTGF